MIVVLSGVSGSGKDTIKQRLIEEGNNITTIPSYTSREKRNYEVEGNEYFFVTKEEFEKMISDGKFYEYNVHHNNYYGTSKEVLDNAIAEGKVIIKDIDVDGTKALKEIFSDTDIKVVTIFLYITKEEMKKRLLERKDNLSDEEIELRCKRYDYENEQAKDYDYIIRNDDLDKTLKQVYEIIQNERNK